MRTLTADQQALYTSGDFAIQCKVLVDSTGNLNWVDLSTYLGRNWIVSVSYQDDVDSPMQTGKVQLVKDVFQLSTSPYRYNSKLNAGSALLFVGRRIQVYLGASAPDMPMASPLNLVCDAVIEEIDASGETVDLTIRDFIGAVIQNSYIRAQTVYGTTAGTPVQTVMQSIIQSWVNIPTGLNIQLAVNTFPVPPAYLITPYLQDKQTVQEALATLSQSLGWVVKPIWNATAGAFALTFYQPLRSATSAIFTFTADHYSKISQLGVSRAGVRNFISGMYQDATTLIHNTVVVQDNTSIAKYGPPALYMELTEDAHQGIDSLAKMNVLLNAILSDLKDPVATMTATMYPMWWCELNDIYTFKANARHFDVDINMAVTAYTTTVDKDGGRTELKLRGQPTGGYKRWLTLEGRTGVAVTSDDAAPTTPVMQTAADVASIIVTVMPPKDTDNWLTTNVYCSPTVIPDPTIITVSEGTDGQGNPNPPIQRYSLPSSTLLVAQGKQTRFTIDGLTPGATYYTRACIIDKWGNASFISNQVATATLRVGPYHDNRDGANYQMVPNNDFCIFTKDKTLVPPDAWNIENGAAGYADAKFGAYYDTSLNQSGNVCMKVRTSASGTNYTNADIVSDLVACLGNDIVAVSGLVYAVKDPTAPSTAFGPLVAGTKSKENAADMNSSNSLYAEAMLVQIGVDFYDTNKALLVSSAGGSNTVSIQYPMEFSLYDFTRRYGTWQNMRALVLTPSTARYFKVRVRCRAQRATAQVLIDSESGTYYGTGWQDMGSGASPTQDAKYAEYPLWIYIDRVGVTKSFAHGNYQIPATQSFPTGVGTTAIGVALTPSYAYSNAVATTADNQTIGMSLSANNYVITLGVAGVYDFAAQVTFFYNAQSTPSTPRLLQVLIQKNGVVVGYGSFSTPANGTNSPVVTASCSAITCTTADQITLFAAETTVSGDAQWSILDARFQVQQTIRQEI